MASRPATEMETITYLHGTINRLQDENKRYRAAIEQALEKLNGVTAVSYEVATAYTELAKVLEDRKND